MADIINKSETYIDGLIESIQELNIIDSVVSNDSVETEKKDVTEKEDATEKEAVKDKDNATEKEDATEKENTKLSKDKIKEYCFSELNKIMDNWCTSYANNCTGGEMRGGRGEDIEVFVRNIINMIGDNTNRKLVAVKGSNDKKEMKVTVSNKEITKEHQVDIHIYLDNIFIAVIECKAYLESCYYVRACDDFKLFRKFEYHVKNYIFSLEESLNEDTKIFTDYINDNICDNIFYILDGKRTSSKPIYDSKFRKKINIDKLNTFIDCMYSLLDTPDE